MNAQVLPFLVDAPLPEEAAACLERVKLKAAANLEVLAETLTIRGVDPTASFKAILDAAEFNYKLSGMAAKQQTPAGASGFSLTINIGGGGGADQTVTISAEKPDELGEPPAYLQLLPVTSDLQADPD